MSWLCVSCQNTKKNNGMCANTNTMCPNLSLSNESPGKIRHSRHLIASISCIVKMRVPHRKKCVLSYYLVYKTLCFSVLAYSLKSINSVPSSSLSKHKFTVRPIAIVR